MITLNLSIIPRGSRVKLLRSIRMSCGALIEPGTEFMVVRSFLSLKEDQTPVISHKLQAISNNGTRDYTVQTKYMRPARMTEYLEEVPTTISVPVNSQPMASVGMAGGLGDY